jgi:hypothetical protein
MIDIMDAARSAITLTFYRLGKVKLWDALFYAVARFAVQCLA